MPQDELLCPTHLKGTREHWPTGPDPRSAPPSSKCPTVKRADTLTVLPTRKLLENNYNQTSHFTTERSAQNQKDGRLRHGDEKVIHGTTILRNTPKENWSQSAVLNSVSSRTKPDQHCRGAVLNRESTKHFLTVEDPKRGIGVRKKKTLESRTAINWKRRFHNNGLASHCRRRNLPVQRHTSAVLNRQLLALKMSKLRPGVNVVRSNLQGKEH